MTIITIVSPVTLLPVRHTSVTLSCCLCGTETVIQQQVRAVKHELKSLHWFSDTWSLLMLLLTGHKETFIDHQQGTLQQEAALSSDPVQMLFAESSLTGLACSMCPLSASLLTCIWSKSVYSTETLYTNPGCFYNPELCSHLQIQKPGPTTAAIYCQWKLLQSTTDSAGVQQHEGGKLTQAQLYADLLWCSSVIAEWEQMWSGFQWKLKQSQTSWFVCLCNWRQQSSLLLLVCRGGYLRQQPSCK